MKKKSFWKIFRDYHIYYNTMIGRFLKWRRRKMNTKVKV